MCNWPSFIIFAFSVFKSSLQCHNSCVYCIIIFIKSCLDFIKSFLVPDSAFLMFFFFFFGRKGPFIPRHTIVTPPYDSGGASWYHVGCPCVRSSATRPYFRFRTVSWVTISGFSPKLVQYVHWYCRGLVWESYRPNFVNFWQSYLPSTQPYFHFRTITWVSLNLICAKIIRRYGLGLLMGHFIILLTYLPETRWERSIIVSRFHWCLVRPRLGLHILPNAVDLAYFTGVFYTRPLILDFGFVHLFAIYTHKCMRLHFWM